MIDLRCEGRAVACRVAKTPSDLLGRRAQRECGSKLGRRVIASGRTAMPASPSAAVTLATSNSLSDDQRPEPDQPLHLCR